MLVLIVVPLGKHNFRGRSSKQTKLFLRGDAILYGTVGWRVVLSLPPSSWNEFRQLFAGRRLICIKVRVWVWARGEEEEEEIESSDPVAFTYCVYHSTAYKLRAQAPKWMKTLLQSRSSNHQLLLPESLHLARGGTFQRKKVYRKQFRSKKVFSPYIEQNINDLPN